MFIGKVPRFALSRWFVPTACLAAFAAMAAVYAAYPHLYLVLVWCMTRVPAPHPFTDWEWIPAAVRCWSEGVDVYVNNICYKTAANLGWNYPPLWLRLTFLKYDEDWVGVTATAAILLFFASLALFAPPRRRRDQVIATLAALSSGTFLAVERANADILIFLMLMAAMLLHRLALPFRLLGYAILILAGLLKFYPFVALVIVARERLAVVAGVALVGFVAVAWTVVGYHDEIAIMLRQMPPLSIYTLQFGAINLPTGIGVCLAKALDHWAGFDAAAARAIGAACARGLRPILALASLAVAAAICRRTELVADEARLAGTTEWLLVVGAAVVCGCFFAGQSVLYRGIFLLLTLPGLAALGARDAAIRRGAALAAVAAAFVLWHPFLETYLYFAGLVELLRYEADPYTSLPARPLGFLLWFMGELAWWWIVTFLLAVLGAFVVRTALWRTALRIATAALSVAGRRPAG